MVKQHRNEVRKRNKIDRKKCVVKQSKAMQTLKVFSHDAENEVHFLVL